jgi:hypothetical protein
MVFAGVIWMHREIGRLTEENQDLWLRCRNLETIVTDALATFPPDRPLPYWAAILDSDIKQHFLQITPPEQQTSVRRVRRRLLTRTLFFRRPE